MYTVSCSKFLLTLFFSTICLYGLGQHDFKLKMPKNEIRKQYDSIARVIDNYNWIHVQADSTEVYDQNDINKLLGLYKEYRFYDSSRRLGKVQINRFNEETSTYYFSDTLLIKSITSLKNKAEPIVNYYGISPSYVSPYYIQRLVKQFPEYGEFLGYLLIGLDFLREDAIIKIKK
jgi:hypothetical protein